MNFYTLLSLLMILTASFSYINYRFIKLPATIGIMLISLITSLVIVWIGSFYPSMLKSSVATIKAFQFENLLMNVMLSFLLFAGALHVDLKKLKRELIPIVVFSTIGVVISTLCIGSAVYFLFQLFGTNIPLIYCFLFGALISPTDPIAVLGILKKAGIAEALETKIVGESLFNDGIGVVIFLSLFEAATAGTANLSVLQISELFLKEAIGGIILGFIVGYIGFYLLKSIDHYQVEVLITLAIVMGGYSIASALKVSGPLAMVIAGVITGNQSMEQAMSSTTRDYLNKFWELIDEILNAVLFILIGFEILIISLNGNLFWISIISIPIVLIARLISVYIPIFILSFKRTFEKNTVMVLTWGGLRGGISVALALSLSASMYKHEFLSMTYVIVVFSILAQGMTIGRIARKLA